MDLTIANKPKCRLFCVTGCEREGKRRAKTECKSKAKFRRSLIKYTKWIKCTNCAPLMNVY